MKKKCAIACIIHTNTLKDYEMVSLRHLLTYLKDYDKFLVVPKRSKLSIKGFERKEFDKEYFESIMGNSKLCVSEEFYNAFKDYDYLLTHHFDALVFKNELEYWINKEYDYIGAPWLKEVFPSLENSEIGNGGFSLRKISSFLKVLEKISWGKNPDFFNRLFKQEAEDRYWGVRVPKAFPWFKVAPPLEALKFAFETGPRTCLQLNNNQLPFGCHGFNKFDPVFWRKYLLKDVYIEPPTSDPTGIYAPPPLPNSFKNKMKIKKIIFIRGLYKMGKKFKKTFHIKEKGLDQELKEIISSKI